MYTIDEFYLITFLLILCSAYLLHFKFKWASYIIMFCGLFSSITYIIWRFTVIPPRGFSLIMGLALIIAEILGIIQFFNFGYFSTRKYKLKKKLLINPLSDEVPTIDILICTYNEPVDLLKKTAIAAKNLTYNKKNLQIFICDDGKRKEVKDFCEDYNLIYITRDSNEGAKAGNINNALKYSKSEFISILDADMIVKNNFLIKTLQYFLDDPLLAFVQVPQSYYNADMYQYNMLNSLPNEQDLFMRDIQEARASINAVLHVGTNAIFRRNHLDSIGGFPTFSITEDMALGMMLQSKGYNSLFVNEPLVLGLSATTLEETVKQRKRWARGNIQVFKRHNPLFSKGLKFKQKIAYLDGLFYWFGSLQKIIYIIAPITYLLFGILSIDSSVYRLLSFYLPFLISQMMVFKILSPGTRNLKWSHYYETVMAPAISSSILTELFSLKPIGFKVTAKDITYEKAHFQFKFILPHLILLIATIISWILAGYYIYKGYLVPSYIILNIFWSIYNAFGLFVAIKIAYQKPIFRSTERVLIQNKFATNVKIRDIESKILLHDISDKGLGAYLIDDIKLIPNEKIYLTLNNILIEGKVVRKINSLIGIQFENLNEIQTTEIIKIYVENLKPYYSLNRDKNEKSLS